MKTAIAKYFKLILDPSRRDRLLYRLLFGAFTLVSAVMTVVNVVTGFEALRNATLIFAIACAINFVLTFLGNRGIKISSILFMIELIVLFTFFMINGSPEGFSAFWAPMLPACGLLMLGAINGTIVNTVMLLIVIFLCWTKTGNALIQFEYTKSFLLRFPLLYMGYTIIGYLIGFMLISTQNAYYNLLSHDSLTGELNRVGFENAVDSTIREKMRAADKEHGEADISSKTIGFIIIDLDRFKRVNDTFGHYMGDKILQHSAQIINGCTKECRVCRWGGEEFAVFVPDGSQTRKVADEICEGFAKNNYSDEKYEIRQTASLGAAEFTLTEGLSPEKMCAVADEGLYRAKKNGRNQVDYIPSVEGDKKLGIY